MPAVPPSPLRRRRTGVIATAAVAAALLAPTAAAAYAPTLFTPGQRGTGAITADGKFYGPGASAAIDLDQDGDLDLAVAEADGSFALATNDGQAHFAVLAGSKARFSPALSGSVTAMAAADLNRDGKTDLVLSSGNGTWAFVATGGGQFAAGTRITTGRAVLAANLIIAKANADAYPDVVLGGDGVSATSTGATLFKGTAAGTFGAGVRVGVGLGDEVTPSAIKVADLNGDGKQDLILAGKGPTRIIGIFDFTGPNPDPYFGEGGVDDAVGYQPTGIDTGDINGDGLTDMVFAFSGYQGPPSPGLGPLPSVSTAVAVQYQGQYLGTQGSGFDVADGPSARSILLADLDGDGASDVIVRRAGELLDLHTSGGVNERQAATFESPVVADFNGDGRPDIAGISTKSNTIGLLLNRAPASSSVLLNTFKAPSTGSVSVSTAAPLASGVRYRVTVAGAFSTINRSNYFAYGAKWCGPIDPIYLKNANAESAIAVTKGNCPATTPTSRITFSRGGPFYDPTPDRDRLPAPADLPQNVYEYTVYGQGQPLTVKLTDNTADNNGRLRITAVALG